MDTNTTIMGSIEVDTTKDLDSLYCELEKQILTLIADDENEDRFVAVKQPTSRRVWIDRPKYILEQQNGSYFCWKYDFENISDSLPVWLMNSWRNKNQLGTGVFIPRTRIQNKPSKKMDRQRKKVR
ncbi:hypothetical protein E3N88_19700 [Mikania micrantha]|uniref:Uncharacterized protein n=1 Tax=Mikania micrantha TaxID=192012 RepID=A0A5N6NPG3_9ASTR|nr:hypothetical protein E3N88_19700 [Mikania micrantha]